MEDGCTLYKRSIVFTEGFSGVIKQIFLLLQVLNFNERYNTEAKSKKELYLEVK